MSVYVDSTDDTVQFQPFVSAAGTLSAIPPSVQPANGHTQLSNGTTTIKGFQDHGSRTNAKVASGCSKTKILAMINDIHEDRTLTNEEMVWLWQKVRSFLRNNHCSTMIPAATPISRVVGDLGSVAYSAPMTPHPIQRQPEAMSSQMDVRRQLSVNTLLQHVAAVYGIRQPRPSIHVHRYMSSGMMTRPKQHRIVIPGETQAKLTRPLV